MVIIRRRYAQMTIAVSSGLLDELGGLEQDLLGDREVEGLGRLKVDDEFKRGGLLDREVSRQGPFEDAVHIVGGPTPEVGDARAIGHQPASFYEVSPLRH